MSWFSHKKKATADKVESRFQQGLVLVKDLDKKEGIMKDA